MSEADSRRDSRRIDFSCSSIRWVTKDSRSHGAFRIESILRVLAADGRDKETFALGTGVLAGNMYAPSGLVKEPAYLFQIAASTEQHVIYRTYVQPEVQPMASSGNKLLRRANEDDTYGVNRQAFESLDIHLATESAQQIETYADIARHYNCCADFTGVLGLSLAGGGRMELEFPIKHFNLLQGNEMFQVETGPILFADPVDVSAQRADCLRELIPGFVHFNRFDQAEVSLDFPFGSRRSQLRGGMPIKTLNCDIKFLVDHNPTNSWRS